MSAQAVQISTFKLRPGREADFSAWQIEHNRIVIRFPGYISSDIMAPVKPGDNEWTLLLNFQDAGLLLKWQNSEERARLIGQVLPLVEGGNLGQVMPKDNSAQQPGTNVTQVILSKVKPGMEEAYRAWAVKIQQAQAKYPGYRGTYLQPPAPGRGGHWTTMLRYDTGEHLEAWLASPERAELLKESKNFIESEELMRLATSFPGWVPIDPATGEGPPNWKVALLILLVLFPIVMLEMRFVVPFLDRLKVHDALITFLCNLNNVMVTGCIAMPLFVRWFGWWLFVKKDSSQKTTLRGVVILVAIFAAELILFWHLVS